VLAEPPVLLEPPLLPEPAMHEPLTHVPPAWVQSVHIPPAVPQALFTPVWQMPLLSQQPMGHDVAHALVDPPLLVLPPPLVVVPPPLVLDPPPLVELPLALVLIPLLVELPLPLLLPVLDPPLLPLVVLKKPASPNAPFPGPPVAHAKASPPSESKTIPRAANPPRKCILSVYLSGIPLQGAVEPFE
jgi:hypothetical protein